MSSTAPSEIVGWLVEKKGKIAQLKYKKGKAWSSIVVGPDGRLGTTSMRCREFVRWIQKKTSPLEKGLVVEVQTGTSILVEKQGLVVGTQKGTSELHFW